MVGRRVIPGFAAPCAGSAQSGQMLLDACYVEQFAHHACGTSQAKFRFCTKMFTDQQQAAEAGGVDLPGLRKVQTQSLLRLTRGEFADLPE
ncbi:hypothetical protein AT959_18530 [Dechloromonas denitrificans]|uniref:Uncharacterized protein n=1 Tax=Dechloromonas denitrificans TaxID=281362 RepID=A0A133XE15_9RHOO|nr:hypothetical protein AT959_18530 [Dechloromonas denitrificans]